MDSVNNKLDSDHLNMDNAPKQFIFREVLNEAV